jgi:hypothetical protein
VEDRSRASSSRRSRIWGQITNSRADLASVVAVAGEQVQQTAQILADVRKGVLVSGQRIGFTV